MLFIVCTCLQTTEETRTVRDSHGNEETTVTRSGGPSDPEGSRDSNSPLVSGQYSPRQAEKPFCDFCCTILLCNNKWVPTLVVAEYNGWLRTLRFSHWRSPVVFPLQVQTSLTCRTTCPCSPGSSEASEAESSLFTPCFHLSGLQLWIYLFPH